MADAALLKRIRTVHLGLRRTYGAPRIHAEFRELGEWVGRKAARRPLVRLRTLSTATSRPKHRTECGSPLDSSGYRNTPKGGLYDEPTKAALGSIERTSVLLRAQDYGVRAIARHLKRDPSTVSRELRRNAATRSRR